MALLVNKGPNHFVARVPYIRGRRNSDRAIGRPLNWPNMQLADPIDMIEYQWKDSRFCFMRL